MSFRFWRRIRIAPGITLNLSKSGGSLSFGPRGAKYTISPRGKRVTMGIPGTGLFYTTTFQEGKSGARRSRSSSDQDLPSAHAQAESLTLGFFKRLITPDDEKALVDGCRELILGNEEKALEYLEQAVNLADGAYLAGFLALNQKRLEAAANYLSTAAENYHNLGKHLSKYGISATISLPITDEVSAYVNPDLRGVLLGLVEVYQSQKRWQNAITCLERLRRLEPEDVVVKLSLAELLWDNSTRLPGSERDKKIYQKIVRLAEGIENETPIHTALLLYKARALRGLGLLDATRETLTYALRRKKNRSEELLRALRYERALTYEELGQNSRARAEFEKLYAEDPEYEDVATRLGL